VRSESDRARRAVTAYVGKGTDAMRASGRDRAHFAAIAKAMAAEKRQQIARAASNRPGDNLREGLALARSFPAPPSARAEDDRRAAGQLELALRGRRLFPPRT